jgi:hypothetical protein
MTESLEPLPEPLKIPCPTCREPIDPRARKCIHCDSYVDWRSFLSVSQTTLALLIALITVASSTLPGLYGWLAPHNSKLRPEFKQIYNQFLELYFFNDGDRPGQLVRVSLSATTADGHR